MESKKTPRLSDISPPVHEGAPVFPGDTPYRQRWAATIAPGCPVNVSEITLSPHVGSHADAPLHYERFGPPPVVDGVPFELELARSQRVLSVPADRSALDVMPDRDSTTAYSCQQGFCGTCKVKVLGGQVDRRGRTVEGDDEMLVCVSRAKSGRVVIDA